MLVPFAPGFRLDRRRIRPVQVHESGEGDFRRVPAELGMESCYCGREGAFLMRREGERARDSVEGDHCFQLPADTALGHCCGGSEIWSYATSVKMLASYCTGCPR